MVLDAVVCVRFRRRADVVGIFANLARPASPGQSVLIETHDESKVNDG